MSVVIHYNSQVVVRHINGDYEAKMERMREYLGMIKGKVSEGLSAKFVQIPREENEQVDRLAKAASTECMVITNQVLSFIQYSPAIDKVEIQVIPIGTDWMMSIVSYLNNGALPKDRNASNRLKVQSSHFMLIENVLYKKGFSHPYLRCLAPMEAYYFMREVHEGVCGNHSKEHSLVHKLIRAGYNWPTM